MLNVLNSNQLGSATGNEVVSLEDIHLSGPIQAPPSLTSLGFEVAFNHGTDSTGSILGASQAEGFTSLLIEAFQACLNTQAAHFALAAEAASMAHEQYMHASRTSRDTLSNIGNIFGSGLRVLSAFQSLTGTGDKL